MKRLILFRTISYEFLNASIYLCQFIFFSRLGCAIAADKCEVVTVYGKGVFTVGHIIEYKIQLDGIAINRIGKFKMVFFVKTHTAVALTVKLVFCIFIVVPCALERSEVMIARTAFTDKDNADYEQYGSQ